MIVREPINELTSRLQEPRKTIQVVAGSRQIGKTTVVKQLLEKVSMPSLYFNADAVTPDDNEWIAARWEEARSSMQFSGSKEFLLAIDEVHKIDN